MKCKSLLVRKLFGAKGYLVQTGSVVKVVWCRAFWCKSSLVESAPGFKGFGVKVLWRKGFLV